MEEAANRRMVANEQAEGPEMIVARQQGDIDSILTQFNEQTISIETTAQTIKVPEIEPLEIDKIKQKQMLEIELRRNIEKKSQLIETYENFVNNLESTEALIRQRVTSTYTRFFLQG